MVSTEEGCPIERAIGAEGEHAHWLRPIGVIERMERRKVSLWRDHEDGSARSGSCRISVVLAGRATVQITVRAERQAGEWVLTVDAAGERVDRGEHSILRQPEDRAHVVVVVVFCGSV